MALGDALGMPTQMLPRARIRERFGRVDRLLEGPPENAISSGEAAGRVTDDTEQALVVARAILAHPEGGEELSRAVADGLVAWFRGLGAEGERALGPSSKRALTAIIDGRPLAEAGARGDTNGASMRIVPVGIAVPPGGALLDLVEAVSLPTHHTGLAMSGAALVAGFVSASIAGAGLEDATVGAIELAEQGAGRGGYVAGASVADRARVTVRLARRAVDESGRQTVVQRLADEVGTGVQTQEAVPTAFGLVQLWPDDPWRVVVEAANLGGDTDTIGCLAGAMAGARCGVQGLPEAVVEQVERVNQLDLRRLAGELLQVRERRERREEARR